MSVVALRDEVRHSLTDATRRTYNRDCDQFTAWCSERESRSLPAEPQTVAAYLAFLARTYRPATIARKLAAISIAHRDLGFDNPAAHGVVRRTLSDIRRQLGTAPHQKTALLAADIRKIVSALGSTLLDARDRALLLLGFNAALRRSELVALTVASLRFEDEGLILTLERSKANQERCLETIAVPYGVDLLTCPVRAVRRWLDDAGLNTGPVFRGLTPQGGLRDTALDDRMVAHVVKRRCKAVGIDPAGVAGDSLRRGSATSCSLRRGWMPNFVVVPQ
jgi:site-specific recombinase XerD